jgi:hypothetical protein
MKTYGGMNVQTHIFLTSALVGLKWSASRSGRLNPGERAPDTHWIGGWMGPRASLNDMEKWKFLPLSGLDSDPLVIQPVASHYTDCAILALVYNVNYLANGMQQNASWEENRRSDSKEIFRILWSLNVHYHVHKI